MLRASVLCVALGVSAAVEPAPGHATHALTPAGKETRKIKSSITLGAAVGEGANDDQSWRYTPEGFLKLTKDHPMTLSDVQSFVRAFTKSGKAKPDNVSDIVQWDELNNDDSQNSVRLGNVIDLWFYETTFPTMPRGGLETKNNSGKLDFMMLGYDDWYRERFEAVITNCPETKRCFGRWLLQQATKVVNETRDSLAESGSWEGPAIRLRAAGNPRLMKAQEILSNRYGIYQPHTVKDLIMPELHGDLSKAFTKYATENDPGLLNVTSWAEAVVHYRLGDALDNEPPIHPKSIAWALASLSPQPKTIEVLNGGFNFKPSKADTIRYSAWMLKMLSDEIFKLLPDAKVTMPTDRSLRKTTVDQDWAKLLHAKSLVSCPDPQPMPLRLPADPCANGVSRSHMPSLPLVSCASRFGSSRLFLRWLVLARLDSRQQSRAITQTPRFRLGRPHTGMACSRARPMDTTRTCRTPCT